MSEIITCPSCHRKLQVPETLAGQDVQCPTCGATFVARMGSAPPDRPPSGPPLEHWDKTRPPNDDDRPPRERRPADDDEFDDDYGPRRRRRDLVPHRGGLILTVGLVGLLGAFICPIVAPFAWIMGNTDMGEIRAGRMDPEGEGLTQAGRVCGMVGSAFGALTVACCLLQMVLGIAQTGMH